MYINNTNKNTYISVIICILIIQIKNTDIRKRVLSLVLYNGYY